MDKPDINAFKIITVYDRRVYLILDPYSRYEAPDFSMFGHAYMTRKEAEEEIKLLYEFRMEQYYEDLKEKGIDFTDKDLVIEK